MSQQSIKKIVSFIVPTLIIVVFLMFGFLKNFLGQADDKALAEAIRGGAFLVDVRTPAEFADGSVAGAVNIPLDKLEARLSEFEGKQSIIVFCRSGARSTQAKSLLDSKGIKGVLNGGTWNNVANVKAGL